MPTGEVLDAGRDAYTRLAWGDAGRLLSAADEQQPLLADDLERLATAAYLTGQDEVALDALERAHQLLLEQGEVTRAVRAAFQLGMMLLQAGHHAQSGGWLARAQRELDGSGLDCVERGYLMIPSAVQALLTGDAEAASVRFREAGEVADRFADPDLIAMTRLGHGQAMVQLGQVDPGVAMLDEAMLAVTSGEVSPVVAGVVYCSVIISCQQVFDLRRAQEWTAALTRWCETQQDLHPYRGQCLIHRSEIFQLQGDWQAAMAEVQQACLHLSRAPGDPVMGMAQYQLAELHRLRGAFAKAEAGYLEASRWGHPVQPGLALLRLAQDKSDDAAAAIRRVVHEERDPVPRSRVLAAHVEIMLAVGDLDAARDGADELAALAADFSSAYLGAIASYARASVSFAEGDAMACCVVLRETAAAWQDLDAPYEVARAQLLMARAHQQLGDRDTARVELAAARRTFEQLDAEPALAQIRALTTRVTEEPAPGGLTPREIEVLTLVAAGRTNRQIADELVISEKTVARHVSNIFTKLGVASRAAATAYAYEHDLV